MSQSFPHFTTEETQGREEKRKGYREDSVKQVQRGKRGGGGGN